ncbi:MAG: tRNA 2-thiouridine(34) synthase MnmA [Deltaproteobacteria bacterium]|nr:tRNA 2-thiouridine(34) synthase MnmA [Deltaproteobacteria bacterium]
MAEKIAVAMSGGVDSTVCAALLRESHEVHGFFMDLGLPESQAQIAGVRRIADQLGIPLEIVDLAEVFQHEVIDYFCRSYGAGITPNPCVICNPRIKCGKLFDTVRALGITKMATGHYARLRSGAGGMRLLRGADRGKDQSYFLCGLNQEQLRGLVFPLGEYTKDEVYRLAGSLGFAHRHDTESQDICFLKTGEIGDFLKNRTDCQKGDIVTVNGEKIGRHQGIFHFTVGQRRGLGVCDRTPYYVTGLCAEKNQVIVGKEADLWRHELLVRTINWLSGSAPRLPLWVRVKMRYRHRAAAAELSRAGDLFRIVFAEPQRAITPGQFAVFYDNDEVVGGGEIVNRA